MSRSRFLDELKVDELSYGAALCLWGFRVSAIAHARCSCVTPAFEEAFGDQGKLAREALRALVGGLVGEGKRRIWMAGLSSLEITCDEVSILHALDAAQHDDVQVLHAHLRWLLGRNEVPEDLINRFIRAGALLYSHGYAAAPPRRCFPPALAASPAAKVPALCSRASRMISTTRSTEVGHAES